MGAQNGLTDDFGLEVPETQLGMEVLDEAKKLSRFSKTKEYQKLEEHFNNRIAYLQSYMPGGTPITAAPKAERDAWWVAANIIIGEYKQVMSIYESANETVRDQNARRKGA